MHKKCYANKSFFRYHIPGYYQPHQCRFMAPENASEEKKKILSVEKLENGLEGWENEVDQRILEGQDKIRPKEAFFFVSFQVLQDEKEKSFASKHKQGKAVVCT